MDGPAQYLQFGFILISLANLIVIALLIFIFALAVVLRRPEKNRPSTLDLSPLQDTGTNRTPLEREAHA